MPRSIVVIYSLSAPVLATGQAVAAPFDIESDIEAVTVISSIDNDTASLSEDILYEISLDNRIETVLQNGTQISGRLTLRGQRDHPLRPGFAGDFGGQAGPAGGYGGLSGNAAGDMVGARGSLEAAYLEIDGGYGEVRVGRDRGIASRFYEGAPSALSFAGVSNPYLDPTGLKIIRTNHDLTGPSAKLSYATPRILGLRAGVSYTPDASADGLDRAMSALGAQPDLENVFEAGANLSRTLRQSETRIEASIGWSSAEIKSNSVSVRDRITTLSAGANVETGGFELGGSWLKSDNGFDGADYEAWDIGLSRDFGETELSFGYGEADDALAGLSSQGFSLAAARDISEGLTLAVSYQDERLETSDGERSGRGIVVEITLAGDFLRMSAN